MHRFAFAIIAVGVVAGCKGEEKQTFSVPTAAVTRRTITVDASASGAVEPINVIEVKSKSSGQITEMTVETGSIVRPGDLLVQVDTRDVQNQFDQAQADLVAAEERVKVSDAQKKRSDDLFNGRIITAQEHETAQLDYANSQAAVIRARTSLDIARQRLEEATVRAPVGGTVIEKTVALGQVITSATSAFGGGTILLKMADLTKVRMRALFNETDIGNVSPGQPATVMVDAFPDRPFRGSVEKIEPQAVVQQSVTMFPVLVTLSNESGLLKPGMNGEVSVLVDERENALAVPNDAVRNVRELATTAPLVGLDPDSAQAMLREQMSEMGGSGTNGGPTGGRGARESRGDVVLSPDGDNQQGQQGGRGQFQMPEVSDEQCQKVRDAFAKKPDAQQKLAELRQKVQSGELDMTAMRDESQKIYASVGVDGQIARACQMRDRGGRGGREGGAQANAQRPDQGANRGGNAEAAPPQSGAAAPVPRGEFPRNGSRARTALVFVSNAGTFEPRVIRVGVSNLDYTEVISGLKEGEQVALLAAATMQSQREAALQRMQQMGGGIPGLQRQQPSTTPTPVPGPGGGTTVQPPRGGRGQ